MDAKPTTSDGYRGTNKDSGNQMDMKNLIMLLIPAIFILISISLYDNLYSIKYNDLINNADLKNKIEILE